MDITPLLDRSSGSPTRILEKTLERRSNRVSLGDRATPEVGKPTPLL